MCQENNKAFSINKSRPKRKSLPDFTGRPLSLAQDFKSWDCLQNKGGTILVLGLGPGLWAWPPELLKRPCYWLEDPLILSKSQALKSLPSNWLKVSIEQARSIFNQASVYFYRQNSLLSPDFWGAVLGHLFAATWPAKKEFKKEADLFGQAPVLFPGSKQLLLYQELALSFKALGAQNLVYEISFSESQNPEEDLFRVCQGQVPSFCLAINGRGLDAEGRIFAVLRALKVPCVLWLVDSPWHILSRFKLPWWKQAYLALTDPSFLPNLKELGASHAFYLPLATAPHMWQPLPKSWADLAPHFSAAPPLFVGHSTFPSKANYFAAAKIPAHLAELANEMLSLKSQDPSSQANIHWWYQHCPCQLWPGHGARLAGAGAENTSQLRRKIWLSQGLKAGLEIVGDSGWRRLLPEASATRIHPPVDYYKELAKLYAKAKAVLNVTSLLLPASLSQRHFDVWAAGGLLLSDPTRGLELFPKELTAPITIQKPTDLSAKLRELDNNPKFYFELRKNFRQVLQEKHSYTQRIRSIFEAL